MHSEQALAELLRNSTQKIKPTGTRLSYEPISQQALNGLLLDIKLTGVVSQSQDTIEVYAGTILSDLFETILKMGKMLPDCPGVIAIQTVAGAISTGTHGQGLYQATLADSVLEMTVVDSKGNIRRITKENPNFGAYLTSLGCLGIITRVKFQLTDNRIYRCKKFTSSFDFLFNQFLELSVEKVQTKAWWFPWTDQVQVWYMDEASSEEEARYNSNGQELLSIGAADRTMEDTIQMVKQKMARETQDETDSLNNLQVLSRFEVVNDVIGNIYQIMNKGIPIPQINCEISIDVVHFQKLLTKLHSWFQEHNLSLHYPFIFRTTGRSKAWLSSTHNQISIHIGFLMYISEDGSFVKGSLDLLREIEEIISQFGGRPHMGKRFNPDLYQFEERYENWGKFKELMLREDPKGRFRNDFVNKLFKLE